MLSYIENKINNLETLMGSPSSTQEQKILCGQLLAEYRDIYSQYNWEQLSPIEKQARRILLLAESRNSNMMNSIPRIENSIKIYSKITEVEPYIMGMNAHQQFRELLELCCEEKLLIDAGPFTYKTHVSENRVKLVFQRYFDLNKSIEERFYSEAIQKVEELYETFLSIVE